jgi:hypothetical protein
VLVRLFVCVCSWVSEKVIFEERKRKQSTHRSLFPALHVAHLLGLALLDLRADLTLHSSHVRNETQRRLIGTKCVCEKLTKQRDRETTSDREEETQQTDRNRKKKTI